MAAAARNLRRLLRVLQLPRAGTWPPPPPDAGAARGHGGAHARRDPARVPFPPAVPEGAVEEAVDEEVDAGVDGHEEEGEEGQDHDPEGQPVTLVVHIGAEDLDGEDLVAVEHDPGHVADQE